MRFVHTSDWHLGRSFGPVSLVNVQKEFCSWFVGFVKQEKLELVLLAGDIYDRAIPPADMIELFRRTIQELRGNGAVVAVITGNHDSADRVSPYDDLLDPAGVYVRGGYEKVGRVSTHSFEDGPLDLVLLPFLDPQMAPDDFGDQSIEDPLERRRSGTHQSVLADAIRKAEFDLKSSRSVALSHAFVTGGDVSDSERLLQVGGTGCVEASLYENFSYVALGHLHKPQFIGRPEVRYSGTPLPYSFSEDHNKSITVVDIDEVGRCKFEEVPIPIGRSVETIKGNMLELLDGLNYQSAKGKFVRALVTDTETVLDAKIKLETVYPHLVEVNLIGLQSELKYFTDNAGGQLPQLSTLDLARHFWEEIEGKKAPVDIDNVILNALKNLTRGST
jgi:DNA repair protein SbcD/Mre11